VRRRQRAGVEEAEERAAGVDGGERSAGKVKAPAKSHIGAEVVRIEAEALRALAERIAGPMSKAFAQALDLLYESKGRVVVTGMGKSDIIARKIAATL